MLLISRIVVLRVLRCGVVVLFLLLFCRFGALSFCCVAVVLLWFCVACLVACARVCVFVCLCACVFVVLLLLCGCLFV